MKKKNIIITFAIMIVGAIIIVAASNMTKDNNSQDQDDYGSNTYSGEVQDVRLTMEGGWKYILEPSTLQKGVKVRMEVDMSKVTGCMRSIVIPEFGVKKYVTPQDNIIEFTPTRSGTFKIACSMNMGVGSFNVAG